MHAVGGWLQTLPKYQVPPGAPGAPGRDSDAASMASRPNYDKPAATQGKQGYYPFEDFYTVVLSNDYTKNISEPLFSPG